MGVLVSSSSWWRSVVLAVAAVVGAGVVAALLVLATVGHGGISEPSLSTPAVAALERRIAAVEAVNEELVGKLVTLTKLLGSYHDIVLDMDALSVDVAARGLEANSPDGNSNINNNNNNNQKQVVHKLQGSSSQLVGKNSAKNRPSLCIAVPSAKRDMPPAKYVDWLNALAAELDPSNDVVVLRQSLNNNDNGVQRAAAERYGFKVFADTVGWPDVDEPVIPLSFGDSQDRVVWRTKQAADFAATLALCGEQNTDYVLLLEDDAQVAKKFTRKLFERLQHVPAKDFGYVSLYSGIENPAPPPFREITAKDRDGWFWQGDGRHGAVALLFRHDIVQGLSEYVLQNKFKRPVDWLIPGYIGAVLELRNFEMIPNIVQHKSSSSTFHKNKDRQRWKSYSYQYDDGT